MTTQEKTAEKNAGQKKQQPKTTLLSKITVRDCGGHKGAILDIVQKKKDVDHALVHIIGHVSGYTAEQSGIGPYLLFKGNFRATSVINGRKYRSGKLILAGPAESALAGELDGRDDEGTIIAFGITITARYDEKAATFYVFGAEPFVENEMDPLNNLEKLMPPV